MSEEDPKKKSFDHSTGSPKMSEPCSASRPSSAPAPQVPRKAEPPPPTGSRR
uniref:Uncharacterized protein n=1 Tax=Arundo donax TaxID=35708 RepID=A0A0A8YAN3_ARUDO